ncbi:nitroreductase family protein [Amycolatopsis sp. GA6-003]|uniref:nitroreductase family protein n=1 Tax=Amycolatopsis sp. GA6-003 TaxID=2652444 RepID=UPI0039173DBD
MTTSTTPQRVTAARMTAAVAGDPQFTLPERARTLPGLLRVPLPAGLLVEGAAARQVFSGKAATTVLPRVLDLLDGTRTYAEIAASLGLREAEVVSVVSLLYVRGLVEEGIDPAVPAQPVPLWLSRNIDSSRVHRSGHRALRELRSARVAVVGPAHLAAELAALLEANTVRAETRPVETHGRLAVGDLPANALVIGLSDTAKTPGWMYDLDRAVRERNGVWLRAVTAGARLEIGPRFDARVGLDLARWELGAPSPSDDSAGGAADRSAALAMLATEITHVLARIGGGEGLTAAIRIDLASGKTSALAVAPGPLATRAGDGTPSVAISFDEMVRFPPKDQAFPKGHLMHYLPANTAKQFDHKVYAQVRRVALPPVTAADLPVLAAADAPAGLERLVLAVRTAFGLRPGGGEPADGHVRRYHATGGNLGSPQAYLAIREVDGLAPGWWSYDPFAHEFAAVSRFDGASERWLAEAAPDAPAVVVATGALTRVAGKYAAFGARVVHMDAGVALHQLGESCRLLGLAARRIGGFRFGDVARLLGLDPAAEPVTEVVRIDRAGPAAEARGGSFFTGAASVHSGPEFLVPKALGSREDIVTTLIAELQEQPAPVARGRLGGAAWSAREYASALANRHGGRHYGPGEISKDELETWLRRADRAGSLGWAEPGTGQLGYLVLAVRVAGLEPGFHRFSPATGFAEAAALPPGFRVEDASLQAEFGRAAAIGAVLGRTPQAVHELGAHGYRTLLARGCAAVNEVWLAALAAGRECCGFAGLIPHALTRHGRLDLRTEAPLFTFAVGESPGLG